MPQFPLILKAKLTILNRKCDDIILENDELFTKHDIEKENPY